MMQGADYLEKVAVSYANGRSRNARRHAIYKILVN